MLFQSSLHELLSCVFVVGLSHVELVVQWFIFHVMASNWLLVGVEGDLHYRKYQCFWLHVVKLTGEAPCNFSEKPWRRYFHVFWYVMNVHDIDT